MPHPSTTLEYSSPADDDRRRPIRRMILIAILIALLIAAIRWGGPIWSQWQLLRWQDQVLHHLDPRGTVVYEEDPAEASRLLMTGNYHRAPYSGTFAGTDWDPVIVMRHSQFGDFLFAHALKSSTHAPRLVTVTCKNLNEEALGRGRVIELTAGVFIPATYRPGSRMLLISVSTLDGAEGLSAGDRVRFYGGELDPHDASHFIIRYQLNERAGIIDGQLLDEDKVVMTLR
jgi:hypothetical protein